MPGSGMIYGIMKRLFEDFYKQNDCLLKSKTKTIWNACRDNAIELLQNKAKQSTGRSKIIGKQYVKILKDKL